MTKKVQSAVFFLIVCVCFGLTTKAYGSCAFPANKIEAENCLAGNPSSQWDISGAGDPSIQGFATDISVNVGDTVRFKIDTPATSFSINIYRMGYYGGMGARFITAVTPIAGVSQNQPNCLTDVTAGLAGSGLYDCGNWGVSATWTVPTTATSGIYFAKLTRNDTGGSSHIFFIVRDDSSHSDLLFQTSDTTWQAYNDFGAGSLYGSSSVNFAVNSRSYKVSYNRPFHTRVMENGVSWVFNAEYPMVRWLESNGFDVTYFTGVDSDRNGALIRNHKVFMSVGHDEYWSGNQRSNVEAARNAGVNLAFFSGNEVFWKVRWENSIDTSGTPYRTLVCYKETHADAVIDPLDPPVWTGTWRDPRFSAPADGGRPENALSGTLFMINGPETPALSIKVPAEDGKMRFWRNTTVATQSAGQTVSFPGGSLGFEWDIDSDNGARPAGLFHLSSATYSISNDYLLDNGSTFGNGTATHSLTLYRAPSGALVFSAGSIQWSWGLDATHDAPYYPAFPADVRMQQATVNLLADMGVQPVTLRSGLVAATQSTDTTPASSTITSPTSGAALQPGVGITITGTASDTGGVVGGVEVSVDGGASWHPALGRATWSYAWPPTGSSATILSRAVDDSGNLEIPGAGVTVTIGSGGGGGGTAGSIWPASATPTLADSGENASVELGVKFRSDVSGAVTGIRFYKSAANTGVHIGNLWTAGGTQLASATFGSETATGWQQVNFSTPVAITANTTYVASYFTPTGHYAFDQNYFASTGVDNPPLHILSSPAGGGNGVYHYGTSGFPNLTYNATNYWVDVVFSTGTSTPDTTPPTVTSVTPFNGATGVRTTPTIKATFSEAISPATINSTTFQLILGSSTSEGGTAVPAIVSYDSSTLTATLIPSSPLAPSTSYTAILLGGTADPRIKDTAGNALVSNFTWTFTTASTGPNNGPGGPILIIASTANPFTRYLAEILSAEGLNAYSVQDVSNVTATTLSSYDVAILGEMPLTAAQVSMLTTWVNGGGKLIAMRPDKQLAGLLGLTTSASTLSNAYLAVNTGSAPGAGIVSGSTQFHGTADIYSLNGATPVATLYSNATTPTTFPAVSLVSAGAGQAAAFSYDLARSVVYTRQGNPAWSGQKRDGQAPPIRPDDLYFGAAASDPQPDWIDLNKVAIPQADEQQRLLANLILTMNSSTKPLPRFWYFPSGFKAVVVMTGDDHGNFYGGTGHTVDRFNDFIAASPQGCSVPDWQCVRASAYLFPQNIAANPLTNTQAAAFVAQGFEVGVHVDSTPTCSVWTASQLDSYYSTFLSSFAAQFPSVAAPSTHRMHCVSWSDYDSHPQVALNHGIRLDTTYYYWPASWINNVPGMFTGSGMPMRFADISGNVIDVYQATTQMTDESGQTYPFNIDTLLDNAIGTPGYYGAFVANMHNETYPGPGANAIVSSAQARGVPIVSAQQLLTWLDGRSNSSFGSVTWSGNTLGFTVSAADGARNLRAMLPVNSPSGTLTSIAFNGSPITFTTQTLKGITYAFFAAASGSYQATYGGAVSTFTVSGTISGSGGSGATVQLSGSATGSVTADANGNYSFPNLPNGNYTVTPSKAGYTFNPASQNVAVNGASQTAVNFASAAQTFSISGTISGTGGNAATVALSGAATATTTANASGAYTFGTVANGSYVVTPTKSGFTFTPSGQNVTVNGAGVTAVNFTSTAQTYSISGTISGGGGSAATVTLTGAATATTTSSTTGAFTFTGLSNGSYTVTPTKAGFGFTPASRNVTVNGANVTGTNFTSGTLSSLTLAPTSVVGGATSTGTVVLSAAAPTGGTVVTLQSSNTAVARVPASVTVAAGSTSANFTVTTSAVASNSTVTISATYGVTRTASLAVNAATLSSITTSSSSVVGGNNLTGTVTLNGAAPAGGASITLQSSNTSAAQVPASVLVPAGATSAQFTITTLGVSGATSASITAVRGTTSTVSFTVNRASMTSTSLVLNPSTVTAGQSSIGTVTLNGSAPPGGAVITLSSSNTTRARVPASITIPYNSRSASFTITTSNFPGTSVLISASYGGVIDTVRLFLQ